MSANSLSLGLQIACILVLRYGLTELLPLFSSNGRCNNTSTKLLTIDEVVVLEKPDLVFLFFGANDAVDERVVQHVSLPQYRVNMESIVVTIKKVGMLVTSLCVFLAPTKVLSAGMILE